jgi:hypothetical protein
MIDVVDRTVKHFERHDIFLNFTELVLSLYAVDRIGLELQVRQLFLNFSESMLPLFQGVHWGGQAFQ